MSEPRFSLILPNNKQRQEETKKYNKEKKDFKLITLEGKVYELHSKAIPSEFKAIYKQTDKSWKFPKKVDEKMLKVAIDYIYSGSIPELTTNEVLRLSHLVDILDNRELFSKLSEFLFDTYDTSGKSHAYSQLTSNEFTVSKFLTLVSFTLMLFAMIFFYFDKVLQVMQVKNQELSTNLTALYERDLSLAKSPRQTREIEEHIESSENREETDEGSYAVNARILEALQKELKNLQAEVERLDGTAELVYKKASRRYNDWYNNVEETGESDEDLIYKFATDGSSKNESHGNDTKVYYLYNSTYIGKVYKNLKAYDYSSTEEKMEQLYKSILSSKEIIDASNAGIEYNQIEPKIKELKSRVLGLRQIEQKHSNYTSHLASKRSERTLSKLVSQQELTHLETILAETDQMLARANEQISNSLSQRFERDVFYGHISRQIGKNFISRKLFDFADYRLDNLSQIHTIEEDYRKRLTNKSHLLFYVQDLFGPIYGFYLSKEFPEQPQYIEDKEAFLFYFDFVAGVYEMYPAIKHAGPHFKVDLNSYIKVGVVTDFEGMYLTYGALFRLYVGKAPQGFDVNRERFNDGYIEVNYKNFRVYELEFIE